MWASSKRRVKTDKEPEAQFKSDFAVSSSDSPSSPFSAASSPKSPYSPQSSPLSPVILSPYSESIPFYDAPLPALDLPLIVLTSSTSPPPVLSPLSPNSPSLTSFDDSDNDRQEKRQKIQPRSSHWEPKIKSSRNFDHPVDTHKGDWAGHPVRDLNTAPLTALLVLKPPITSTQRRHGPSNRTGKRAHSPRPHGRQSQQPQVTQKRVCGPPLMSLLADDLLSVVFQFIDPGTVFFRLPAISCRFRDLVLRGRFKAGAPNAIDFRAFSQQITDLSFRRCLDFFNLSELKSLGLRGCTKLAPESFIIICSLSLTRLDLSNCKLDAGLLGQIVCSLPQLTSLRLAGTKAADQTFLLALQLLPALTHLDMKGCALTDRSLISTSTLPSNLSVLVLSDNSFTDYGITTSRSVIGPSLEYLDLSNCRALATQTALAIANRCRNLTYLNLACCTGISSVGVRSILMACANLTHLNLAKVGFVNDDTFRAGTRTVPPPVLPSAPFPPPSLPPPLSDGQASGVHPMIGLTLAAFKPHAWSSSASSSSLSSSSLSSLSHLSSGLSSGVSGDGGSGATDTIDAFPRLRSLILNGCHRLTREGVEFLCDRVGPSLRELDLSECVLNDRTLTAFALRAEAIKLPITRLDLGNNLHLSSTSVAEVIRSLPSLQFLAIAGCFYVEDDDLVEPCRNCNPSLKISRESLGLHRRSLDHLYWAS